MRLGDGVGKKPFKFQAIEQTGERIMAHLMHKAQRVSAFPASVAQYQSNPGKQEGSGDYSDARDQDVA